MRGEGQTGRMPASIAPRRDMLSATWAGEAVPKAASSAASGRRHAACTRNPGLPGIGFLL
jgi:hypothetical protein